MLVEVTYLDDSDLYGIRSLIYTEAGALESSRQDGPLSPWDRAAESDYVCESYSYTAEGALAATTLDLGCDAVADGVVTYTYDEQGALSSAAVTGAWGEGEVSYTYNEQGNLTAEVTAVAGHPLRSERSAYDADGRLATTAIDGGEAGLAVSHRVDRSSVAGELVSTRFDDDGDGAADRVFTYERLDGVVVGAAVDVDGDGEADFDLSFTYDDVTGLHVSTSAFVAGTDGPAVSTWTYTYTAEGLLESDSIDEDFDGVVDLSHAYTYDPQGRVMTQVTTVNPEGESLMYTRSFSYDGDAASPSAATLTGDTAAAGLGAGASATAYSYDDAGRLSGADHSDGEATLSRDDYAYGCWAE